MEYSSKGGYTIKSAYRIYIDTFIDGEEWKIEGDWNKLWAMQVPPTVKKFMLQLGYISTR